jgi:outer membrane protein TolC
LIVPSELVRSRPDTRAAEAQLHAASAAEGIATAHLYPRISLSADVAEQGLLGGPAGAAWSSSAGSPRRSFTAGRSPQIGAPRRTPTRLRSRNINRVPANRGHLAIPKGRYWAAAADGRLSW